MVCVVLVAVKLYHTSYKDPVAQLAGTPVEMVAFLISPLTLKQLVAGVSVTLPEQLSFAGACANVDEEIKKKNTNNMQPKLQLAILLFIGIKFK